MNGLGAVPFFLLFIADIPISIVAFAVLFNSAAYGSLAVVLWGIIGTLWWSLLGRSIDRRLAQFRNKRHSEGVSPSVDQPQGVSTVSPVVSSPRQGNWGIWVAGTFAVLAVALVIFAWAQRALEKADNGGAIGDATFSPDGEFILLSRSQANSEFLYKVAISSGAATRLTSASSGFEGSPSYSHDGKQIAFSYTARKGGHSRIFVVDANGISPRPLFSSEENAEDLFPKFAVNGKICFARAAFFGNYSPIASPHLHEWDLYEVDPDGRNIQPLTHERFYDISPPSISSDGKELLFSVDTQSGSQMQLYFLDSNAPMSEMQPHVPHEPRTPIYANAVLAPDGRSIVFLAASEGARAFDYDVYRLELATKAVERLTTANGYATNLSLSPDGKVAAFLRWSSRFGSTFPTTSRMYLLDLTTKSLTALPIAGTR